MPAELPLTGPRLRLLRLRSGVSQRAVARRMGRGHARVAAVENSVYVSDKVAESYVTAVHRLVIERERMTLEDIR